MANCDDCGGGVCPCGWHLPGFVIPIDRDHFRECGSTRVVDLDDAHKDCCVVMHCPVCDRGHVVETSEVELMASLAVTGGGRSDKPDSEAN